MTAALSTDVADLAWGAVTIRVAWEIGRLKLPHSLLADLRDHVWFHLDPDTPVSVAEDRAELLTRQALSRLRHQPLDDPWPQDAEMPLSPRWRARLFANLGTLPFAVVWMHYAGELSLDAVAARVEEDRLAVEAAREGLREVVRRAAADDGVPLDGWTEARLDRLIHRLACMTAEDAPPVIEVIDGRHAERHARCLRSFRTVSLANAGRITRDDLIPPAQGGRPRDVATVAVLHFHRDGRQHRRPLAKELGPLTRPVGDDLLLADASDATRTWETLTMAAELGAPGRDHLRGAVLAGPGRLSRAGLIGPLRDRVEGAIRATPWGTLEGLGELPAPLPEPPSARGAWLAVGALGAAAVVATVIAVRASGPVIEHPLEIEAVPGRHGLWVDFRVDDAARLAVVREVEGGLELVLDADHPADKARLATGDGSYRLHTTGEAVLLASAADPLPDLSGLLEQVASAPEPLDQLAAALRAQHPTVDVWTGHR